jgi:hypothetical protein
MGVSGQRHAPAALLPPGKGSPVPIVQEAGWAAEPVWTQRLEEKSFAPRRGSNPDRPVVQPVVRHYIDWANPAPKTDVAASKNSEGLILFEDSALIFVKSKCYLSHEQIVLLTWHRASLSC